MRAAGDDGTGSASPSAATGPLRVLAAAAESAAGTSISVRRLWLGVDVARPIPTA